MLRLPDVLLEQIVALVDANADEQTKKILRCTCKAITKVLDPIIIDEKHRAFWQFQNLFHRIPASPKLSGLRLRITRDFPKVYEGLHDRLLFQYSSDEEGCPFSMTVVLYVDTSIHMTFCYYLRTEQRYRHFTMGTDNSGGVMLNLSNYRKYDQTLVQLVEEHMLLPWYHDHQADMLTSIRSLQSVLNLMVRPRPQSSMLRLPDVLLEQIVAVAGEKTRTTLRGTCKTMRKIVDRGSFEVFRELFDQIPASPMFRDLEFHITKNFPLVYNGLHHRFSFQYRSSEVYPFTLMVVLHTNARIYFTLHDGRRHYSMEALPYSRRSGLARSNLGSIRKYRGALIRLIKKQILPSWDRDRREAFLKNKQDLWENICNLRTTLNSITQRASCFQLTQMAMREGLDLFKAAVHRLETSQLPERWADGGMHDDVDSESGEEESEDDE